MTQRERLIELVVDGNIDADESGANSRLERCEKVTDWLLANGVVVLPCKVGGTVYRIVDMESFSLYENFIGKEKIASVSPTYRDLFGGLRDLPMDDFGITWFCTKEEAEGALGRKDGDK